MDYSKILNRIDELEREIAFLPPGNISVKKIRGKEYWYHRFSVSGKRSENYVSFDAVDGLRSKIEKRKALEAELKGLRKCLPVLKSACGKIESYRFKTYVRTGEQLANWVSSAKNFNRRECFGKLRDYVFGDEREKVFVLYGLRRSGKTTLIRQVILSMTADQFEKAALIQVKTTHSLSAVNSDLNYLEKSGYKYIFIDEVTLMKDFIEGAALFSDIYACSGMKIVLSGTDSLGFVFTAQDRLYDRCIMLHTTFIPYREFENVLGIRGVDEFIRYGGTMSMGGTEYNEKSSFATKESAAEYVDSAIARNIQHSLKYYEDGGHFRHLYELYRKDELTSAINRVVEDMNHRFVKETLTKTFISNDLSITARNLLQDRSESFDLYENIERDFVVHSIKIMLEILDKEEQSVEIDESHVYQIKEYLSLLDLITEVDIVHFPNINIRDKKVIITQPGLRYAQAKAFVNSLLLDEKFNLLSVEERGRVLERALGAIKGRMIEEQVLLETKEAKPRKEVFQLQFAVGEFDMVIHDPESLTCEIFEIKHSSEIVPAQYRHLINEEKCAATEHRFGRITGKYVIYRGKPAESGGIGYLNVEEYLKSLA